MIGNVYFVKRELFQRQRQQELETFSIYGVKLSAMTQANSLVELRVFFHMEMLVRRLTSQQVLPLELRRIQPSYGRIMILQQLVQVGISFRVNQIGTSSQNVSMLVQV
jgi:hypothetical protein